jgi:PIN domain nuclease of toxin-antitoxin system
MTACAARVGAWLERFLNRPGIEAIPLGYRAASRAYQLHHLEHRDLADRLLISTAIELECPLITYDERIARFGKRRGRQYRFAAGA